MPILSLLPKRRTRPATRGPQNRFPTAEAVQFKKRIESFLTPYHSQLDSTWNAIRPEVRAIVSDAPLDEIERHLTAMERAFLELLKRGGEPQLVREIAEAWGQSVLRKERKHFSERIKSFTGVDPLVDNRPLLGAVQSSVAENVTLISNLPIELHARAQRVILDGVRLGLSTKDIAKQLEQLTGFTSQRAAFIARDQTGKLQGTLVKEQHKQAGLKRFRWITKQDERVRHTHEQLHGRIFTWEEGAPRSLSPSGFPGYDIICRCHAEAIREEIVSFV